MADMSYQDKLSTLGNMSDAELSALQTHVLSAFEDADSNDDLVAMSAAADALEQITEVSRGRAGEITNDVEALGSQPNSDVAGQNSVAPLAASAADEDAEAEVDDDAPDADTDEAPDEDDDADAEDAEVVEDAADEPAPDSTTVTAAADAEAEADADADEPVLDADGEPIDGVTAGSMPAGLKNYEFKKKGAKGAVKAAADDGSDDDADADDDESVTASSNQGQSNLEETNVPVEQKDIPEERRPLVASASSPVVRAGADIPGISAGTTFVSERDLSEAFVKRLTAFQGGRGPDGDKVVIASVASDVTDPDRVLNAQDNNEVTANKINSIIRAMRTMGPSAVVASGGYCAPLETRYDIFGVGVTDRPVRDSLAGFQATRGGIRYVAPPILSSFSGAVGLWTAANDANPSSPATKPFLTAVCQNEITVTADAITLEIQFGNLMTRAFPELVARNNELGLIYQARFAEQTLLNKISALSTAVSATWQLGTARDFLNSVGRLATAYRTRHRLNHEDALRVIAPAWVLDAMREDLTRGSIAAGPESIVWADSLINASLASRNVNITWHLDDPLFTGVQNTGPINDFPASIKYWLFAEGTFLFLDGGTLDLGIVRDSTLVGTNDYRMFVETFEGLAKVGIESIQATVTTHITGANVGTVTPT